MPFSGLLFVCLLFSPKHVFPADEYFLLVCNGRKFTAEQVMIAVIVFGTSLV